MSSTVTRIVLVISTCIISASGLVHSFPGVTSTGTQSSEVQSTQIGNNEDSTLPSVNANSILTGKKDSASASEDPSTSFPPPSVTDHDDSSGNDGLSVETRDTLIIVAIPCGAVGVLGVVTAIGVCIARKKGYCKDCNMCSNNTNCCCCCSTIVNGDGNDSGARGQPTDSPPEYSETKQ